MSAEPQHSPAAKKKVNLKYVQTFGNFECPLLIQATVMHLVQRRERYELHLTTDAI